MNLYLSKIVSDIAEPLVEDITGGEEIISTEDGLARAEEVNNDMGVWHVNHAWVGVTENIFQACGTNEEEEGYNWQLMNVEICGCYDEVTSYVENMDIDGLDTCGDEGDEGMKNMEMMRKYTTLKNDYDGEGVKGTMDELDTCDDRSDEKMKNLEEMMKNIKLKNFDEKHKGETCTNGDGNEVVSLATKAMFNNHFYQFVKGTKDMKPSPECQSVCLCDKMKRDLMNKYKLESDLFGGTIAKWWTDEEVKGEQSLNFTPKYEELRNQVDKWELKGEESSKTKNREPTNNPSRLKEEQSTINDYFTKLSDME